jgi:hypothetical protein
LIKAQFTRLAGNDQQLAVDIARGVWGKVVADWKSIEGLPAEELSRGLTTLEKMTKDEPPRKEDVPTFHPPNGNPQEGHQVAPGSTIDDGPIRGEEGNSNHDTGGQCEAVSKTGIRCVREPHTDGQHYFAPPRPEERPIKLPDRAHVLVVPDPETGVRHVSNSDGMLLRQWCQQHELMSFFAAAVAKNPRNVHGNVIITEGQYWHIRTAAEALVTMTAPEGVESR